VDVGAARSPGRTLPGAGNLGGGWELDDGSGSLADRITALQRLELKMQEEVLVSGVLPPKKDIQKHEIERLLRKFGFSVEDVVVAVVGASLERNERFGGCRQSLWVTRHRH